MIDAATTKFLSICCTFRRPDKIMDMLDTFRKTKSDGTEIFIYLHEDDPRLADYKRNLEGWNYTVGKHRMLQSCINHVVFDLYPDIPYYQTICDDHLYMTNGWDKIFMENIESKGKGFGFACGRDLINGDDWMKFQHPSAEAYSWKFVNCMGFVYPRQYAHQGQDIWMKDLAAEIGGTIFCPDVIIKHLWYGGCGLQPDENIKEIYSEKAHRQAEEAFKIWLTTQKKETVAKILAAKNA